MPRSFLVKTHAGHRAPNYGRLETRRESDGTCSGCGGPGAPPHLPNTDAPSAPAGPACPQDHASAVACISPPLRPPGEEALGAAGPEPPRASGVAPSGPLQDSLKHPPLPTRWPPILCPDGHGAPDKPPRAEGAPRTAGGFEYGHCHKPCYALAGLAWHQPQCGHLHTGRTFACKFCNKEYSSLGALKMHIRTHTLPCVCGLCGKAFSRPWLLQGHVRTHTGEKPYACPHCGRAFADRSNLRAHLQTHSGAKRYPCRGCAKAFSRMALRARHEEAGCCPGPERQPRLT